MQRITPTFILGFAVLVSATQPGTARADERLDISGFLGAHIFSDNNELGQVDIDVADSPGNALLFGVRVGFAFTDMISAEGELGIMPTSARDSGVDVVVLGWRTHGLVHFTKPGDKLRPFAVLGLGALTSSSTDEALFLNDTDGLFHGGLGVKYRIHDNWGVRADARLMLPPSSESEFATTDLEVMLSLYKTFPPKQKAAAPPKDTDGDGIMDPDDKCAEQAEDKDGYEDDDGCPETDNDSDGIEDTADKCPNEAETRNEIDDDDGCPETDNDGDNVVGSMDKCPEEPEDRDNFEDRDGCPEPDNDGDGFLDADDKCPNEPETKNNFQDDDGCGDTVPVKVQKFTGAILGIRFRTNSAVILKTSNTILDEAVKVLTEHTEIRLEIQGHTDNDGKADRNLVLSQQRADAVKKYFVDKGVDAARLEAKGYGDTKPVAPNDTKENKAKNRRVEFVLLGAAPKE